MSERDDTLAWVREATGATRAERAERVQSLWSGYGEIVRVRLEGAAEETVIVKSVTPPPRSRGAREDRGDARKRRSYDVERAFYRGLAARCDEACRVPRLLASRAARGGWLFVLEDLDAAGFPLRRRGVGSSGLDACLAWLAAFHARFLGVPPKDLWKTGTYWHLATRPDELAQIDDPALAAAAPRLDALLASARHQTILHGDAKPANFCFTPKGEAAAAVDFQYTGGGVGVKDVAYLLEGELASEADEARALDAYFAHLRGAIAREAREGAVDAAAIEAEWRALYPIAKVDFYRFLAGWSKAHYASDARARRLTREVLARLA